MPTRQTSTVKQRPRMPISRQENESRTHYVKPMKKKPKYRGRTGYTLHGRRLEYTGCDAIRTVKYPLQFDDPGAEARIAQAIEGDYIAMCGSVNIDAWMRKPDCYSLMDFWADALRAGGVFQQSAAALTALGSRLSGGRTRGETAWEELPQRLREALEKGAFIEQIVQSTGVRTRSTKENLRRRYKEMFHAEYRNEQWVDDFVTDLIDRIYGKSQEEQRTALATLFEIGRGYFARENSTLTFRLIPDLKLQEDIGVIEAMNRLFKHVASVMSYDNDDNDERILHTQELAGFQDNFNAFSNFFGSVLQALQEGNTGVLADEMLQIHGGWLGREKELRRRLKWLAERAQRIPKPRLTKNWADYRSAFGGKLQGWHSNYDNQRRYIAEQIGQDRKSIAWLGKRLQTKIPPTEEEHVQDLQEVLEIAEDMLEHFDPHVDGFEDRMLAYRDVRSEVNARLNRVVQQTSVFVAEKKAFERKKSNRGKEPNVKDIVPKDESGILAELRLVPKFFGGSRHVQFERYRNAPKIIRSGLAVLDEIGRRLRSSDSHAREVEPEYFRKQLDQLVRRERTANSNKYRASIRSEVTRIAGKYPECSDRREERFHRSPFARDPGLKGISFDIEPRRAAAALAGMVEVFADEGDWTKWTDEQRIDFVEMKKLRMAWLLKLYPCAAVDVSDLDLSHLEKASGFLQLLGTTKLDGGKLPWFVNSYVCSEIRGAMMHMSRREFVVRSVVQMIGSEKGFPLVCDLGVGRGADDARDFVAAAPVPASLRKRPHRFGYAFPMVRGNVPIDPKAVVIWKGKDVASAQHAPQDRVLGPIGWVKTSRAQMQFLHWHLASLRRKGAVSSKRMEPSLILERTYRASWNLSREGVSLALANTRVFMSQPFSLELASITDRKERKKELKQRSRYLGVDVGEYGLGWVVLDGCAQKGDVKLLASGFLHEPNLRHIREYVGLLKQRQIRGTFGVPSTKLERLREQASHALRNRLHDLVMRYDAKLVYEYSISNFETGSARVSTVYRTVKVADVYAETAADRATKEAVWGKATIDMGTHLSAYATSQTCTKCGRCVLNAAEEGIGDTESVRVVECRGRIVFLQKNDGTRMRGYVQEGGVIKDEYKGKTARGIVQAYMRPPVDADHIQQLSVPDWWKEQRGNSAIFVCPYCNHIADADVQAAANVALKGVLYAEERREAEDFFRMMKDERGRLPSVGIDPRIIQEA